MNNLDVRKILLNNIWWLGIIIIAAIWLRLDLNYHSGFPIENATVLKGNLMLKSEGSFVVHDNYSLPFFTSIFTLASNYGVIIGARLISVILSLLMLFFFYKFTYRLFNDKLASAFAVIFFAIQPLIIFLGKFASNDIFSLTLFAAFLMVFVEIYTEDDKNVNVKFINLPKQLLYPIIASVLFVFSAFSNYIIFLYFIPVIILLMLKDRKSLLYFLLSSVLLTFIIYLFNSDIINHQISSIISINNENFKTTKLLIRIAEYIAFPLMLTFALQQIIWKTSVKSSMIFTAIGISLILPLYIIISGDVYNIYRLIPFSLILLAPFCGMIISKFLMINPSYKYATIFAMYFIMLITYWQLTKLETAYPNTDTIVNYCSEYFDKNTTVYCEDPYLVSNAFYPFIKIENFKSIYYMDLKRKSLNQRKEFIIEQLQSGKIHYVILNGLFHLEFTEHIKAKYLKPNYMKIMSQEFTGNTLMYPASEGSYDIYRIKPEYKYVRQYLSKRN